MKIWFIVVVFYAAKVFSYDDNLSNLYNRLLAFDQQTSPIVSDANYVQFEDVKAWSFAPPHHAIGYDDKKNIIAVFDLTYQNTRSLEFIGRSVLGTIGIADINLREIVRKLREIVDNYRHNLPPEARDAMQEKTLGFLDFVLIENVLNNLELNYGDTRTSLRGDWWTHIPLTSHAVFKDGQLERFRLADIDFDRFMTPWEKTQFNELIADISTRLHKIFDINTAHLLEEITVQRNPDHSFDLVLSPHSAIDDANAQPMKVLDLVRFQNTPSYAMLRLLAKTLVSNIGSFIPQPTVAALVQYAVKRYINLYEEQQSFHRFRAYEYIAAAERGEGTSLSILTSEQREKAGIYVLSHEANIFTQLFDPVDKAQFHDSLALEVAKVNLNKLWAEQNNLGLEPLSSMFSYGDLNTTDHKDYLMTMGDQLRFQGKPIAAINYQDTMTERWQRATLKSLGDCLNTMSVPGFPGAGYILGMLYEIFVMDDVKKAESWEARLVSQLHIAQGSFDKEIDILYDRRINPFEFHRDEEQDFIARSKSLLGITD